MADLILGGIGARAFERADGSNLMAVAMEADDPNVISEPILSGFRTFADRQGEDRLALAACARGGNYGFSHEMLGNIRARTLVIAGVHDKLAGGPELLAAAIPDARAISLPGCNHFSAIPHALFKAAVFDFLEG